MTPEQDAHLSKIMQEFCSLVNVKYRRGQAEHGPGNLWDMEAIDILKESRNEAIDQFVYIQTVIDKMEAFLNK